MIYALVVLAAFFNALWNACVKKSDNPTLTLLIINLVGAVVGLGMLVTGDYHLPTNVLPWLAVSVLLRAFYFYLLSLVYKLDDFSRIFPISRALTPLAVLALSLALNTEAITPLQMAGVLTVCGGLLSFVLEKNSVPKTALGQTLIITTLVGLTGGGFVFADGHGVRLSQNYQAFTGWLFLLNGLFYFMTQHLNRPYRKISGNAISLGLVSGLLASAMYALIIWSYSTASVVTTAALKETSIIFSVLIGSIIFKEQNTMTRILGSLGIITGIAVIHLA